MRFEIVAKCSTTKARVCRMVLGRQYLQRCIYDSLTFIYLDGTTILPTFMPVATQAAIKGLTPQQVEALGEYQSILHL